MRLSILSLIAAFVFLNTAPGHDCKGRPLPGYVEVTDDSTEVDELDSMQLDSLYSVVYGDSIPEE